MKVFSMKRRRITVEILYRGNCLPLLLEQLRQKEIGVLKSFRLPDSFDMGTFERELVDYRYVIQSILCQ